MIGTYLKCTVLITMLTPGGLTVHEEIPVNCKITSIQKHEVNQLTEYFVDCSDELEWIKQHPFYKRPLKFWTVKNLGECNE